MHNLDKKRKKTHHFNDKKSLFYIHLLAMLFLKQLALL